MDRKDIIKVYLFSMILGFTIFFMSAFEINHSQGTSMKPLIENNSYHLCYKNYKEINKNDVITFNDSKLDYVVTHKVIEVKENNSYVTKGINNKYPDNSKNYVENYVVDSSEVECKTLIFNYQDLKTK